jgi:DNA polymerase I
MNSGPILLIDAYNVFARSYIVVPIMSSHGHHLGGSIGFMKSLSMYAEKFKPSRIIVCWEGGGSARRRKILPEYKMNRKPIKLNRSEIYEDLPDTKENFNYQIVLTTKLLKNIPVQQLYVDQCEADDIIGYISRYSFPDEEKLIISMDQDLHQLLLDKTKTKQWSPSTKKMMNGSYVLERYGVSVENFITARSFIGDSSDGIKGIKGCGFASIVKRFPELAGNEFVSVDDILKLCEERNKVKPLKLFKNILENPEIPKRNWKLMYLDISNLAAQQINDLREKVAIYNPETKKINMIRELITEGAELPRNINIDRLYMRLNSCIKK